MWRKIKAILTDLFMVWGGGLGDGYKMNISIGKHPEVRITVTKQKDTQESN